MTAGARGAFFWDPDCLGQPSAPIVQEVGAEAVAAFRAVVDPTSAGGAASPAPVTFPARLQTLAVPGLSLPLAGVIHVAQELSYPAGRPLAAGDRVSVVGWVESVRQRGRLAIVVVVNQMREVEERGEDARGAASEPPLLVESRTTVMVTLPLPEEGHP